MKVTKLLVRDGQQIVFFIANDWHYFELDLSAYSILKQHGIDNPHSRLILNGDFLDAWYLMPKNPLYQRWIGRKDAMDQFFCPQYDKEIRWGNFVLDELCKIFDSIYYIFGNHEGKRFDEFVASECPHAYKQHFNIKRDLHLSERGLGVMGCNDYLDISNVSITHGMKEGKSALTQHYLSTSNNTIIGHLHRYEHLAFDSRGEAKFCTSLPAMCHRPDHERMRYMHNKDNRHSTGYGVLTTDGPDNSFLNVYVVKNKKLIIGNKVYEAKKELLEGIEF